MFGMRIGFKAGIALLSFIIDRILKWLALEGYTLQIWGGVTFRFLPNYGATFGVYIPYINVISTVILIFLLWYGYRHPSIGLSLIVLGGFSNVIDRWIYNFVVDYLHIPFLPIVGRTYFNIADVMIDIGVVILIWEMLKN